MKATISILAILSILIVSIACKGDDTKKQQKDQEQRIWHTERMKNYRPIDFSQYIKVVPVIEWKITNRKLLIKEQ